MIDALAYCDQLASGPGRRASGRRHVLFGALAVAATGWAARNPVRACLSAAAPAATQAEAAPPADWQSFKDRFVAADGRVIDTGNGGISHSEGQGYGLLFAERFGDRDVFDRLLGWTEANLRRRSDALHAWRYRPGAAVPVDDWNNASDGDLLIAWALLRAGQRWGNQDYTDLGTAIATDLLALCVREVAGTTVLLPAASGFERPGRVIVNPSYYIFPALAALADAVPHPAWQKLQTDGLHLLRLARFGRWKLPPDWLEVGRDAADQVQPARDWPARFSWDAVRVPLHLAWAGLTAEPALSAAAGFWEDPALGRMPAWADFAGDGIAASSACAGVRAIATLAEAACSGGVASPALPPVGVGEDYYSASLVLLSQIAWRETIGRSVDGFRQQTS